MHKLYSEFIGMSVFDEYSPSPIALIQDVIISPDTGKILAFIVKNNYLIVPMDIERVARGLFVHDRHNIIPASDVPRVEEQIKESTRLVGTRVFTEKQGVYLGRVADYEIDTTHMCLTKIFVAKIFLFLRFQERIISYKNIVKIERDRVTVEDLSKETVKEKVPVQSRAFA